MCIRDRFRITSGLDGADYQAAARRALWALSLVPLWVGSAVLCFSLWPWRQAAAHIMALGLFGVILADACTYGFREIPFTCSYLPGKSQVHMVILGALGLLYFTLFAVRYERDVLESGTATATLLATLLVTAAIVRWRSAGRSTITARVSLYYMAHVLLGVFVNILKYDRRFRRANPESGG